MVNPTLFFRKATVLSLLVAGILFSACNFIKSFDPNNSEGKNGSAKVEITSLALAKQSISMKVGTMDYLGVNIKPQTAQKNLKLNWTYDTSIIECDTSSSWGITIKALKEGQTSLRCSYDGYDANCLVTVSGFSENYEETVEPYIYSNTSILQTSPGVSERVFVSLYGGTAADIDGYTWTNDNPSVCSIEPTGQYCVITAKDSGYARIKITHSRAAYPYYMGIYVFADATNLPYITTTNNIVTMNQGDKSMNISVSLVNGKDTSLDSQFKWQVINDSGECPVELEYNGNNAVVTPARGGSCTLRVTHPDAAYPLDILCRVITIVKNVYIKPSDTVVSLHGDEARTVRCDLENIKEGEYNIDAYEYLLDDYDVAEIVSSVGNEVTLRGKANGSCKLVIKHEKAAYAREVLLIVDGQITDAVDASCYITTTQNYIRTKVGANGTTLSVSLKGGEDGDEASFVWTVTSTAADGSSADVISLETADGTAVYSRAASQTYSFGTAFIEPKNEGTAVITVSHPKVYYSTEILVKVLDENAILESPLYFLGNGLLKILNGESTEYTVQLRGSNKANGDENGIQWKSSDPRIGISSAANIANITAPEHGEGQTVSTLTISHNKADADKKVLVLTADNQETLDGMKALYSDKLYYNIGIGETAYLMTSAVGFRGTSDDDGNYVEYDFSVAQWTVKDSSVASVEKAVDPLTGAVTGLKAGTTTVTVSLDGCTCEYTVTVYPDGAVQTEPEIYFTTSQNVISLDTPGKTATAYISAINMPASEYSNIEWNCSDSEIASVIPNGNKATITSLKDGEAVISVSHPDSQNTLKLYVRVGSEYVISNGAPVVYISSQDVITLLRDDSPVRLDAVLVNYDGQDTGGFKFTVDNDSVASIPNQTAAGIAYVKPVSSGQAEITISHPKTEIEKKVLVVVGNSAEELAGITYLTTKSNVIAVGEGQTKSVSVSVKNSDEIVIDGYTWTSSNPSVIGVTATDANAVITGNSIGTAVITVTNKRCKYSLQIIAQCVDPIAAAANPYIQLSSSVITATVGGGYMNVTADLVGGKSEDYSDFRWLSNDSGICAVFGQNEVGKLRALKAGTTYITVSHPKAAYTAQLLVVCDEVKQSECYISVPSSILNMKPTDSSQTITASLINGSETDRYNFTWSLDVYDVIDLVYSANICTITPKQQGQATITVRHPKSAYEQQIIVTVQEYSDFAFPYTNSTLTQGDVKFYTMQIPNTKMATHVEYSVANSDICTISGTKSTAQIQAVGAGTTTVKAKLVASSTGVTQAESEMLVYIKKADVDAVYISSSSTIFTVNKGKSQTLSAILSGKGITNDDQYNLKWTTNDTDVIQITGISADGSVKGQSIYVTALKGGEALITCSHDKAQSDLQFFIVVPGSAEKIVTLNKTYMTITKGSSGSTLTATIENSESTADYYSIEWSVEKTGADEVCRVMGSGKTVTIYPVNVGETNVIAQLPDSSQVAKCAVKVEAGKSFAFEQAGVKVMPYGTKTIKYTVSPANDGLKWTMNQSEDIFSYTDLGCDENGVGYVEIEGINVGSGMLTCLTDKGAKASLSVRTTWDYEFSVLPATLEGSPDKTYELNYTVNPPDAKIEVSCTDADMLANLQINNDGKGKITVKPLMEIDERFYISVRAVNPKDNDKVIGESKIQSRFAYKNLVPEITLVSDGKFSRFTGGTIYIGDGETVTLTVKIPEKDPPSCKKISVKTAGLISGSGVTHDGAVYGEGTSEAIFSLSGGEDVVKEVYHVTKAYKPMYKGTEIKDWQKNVVLHADPIYNPKSSNNIAMDTRSTIGYYIITTQTWWGSYSITAHTDCYNTAFGGYVSNYETLTSAQFGNKITTGHGKKEDPSLCTEYSVDDFENIPFWYVSKMYSSYESEQNNAGAFLGSGVGAISQLTLEPGIVTEHVTAKKGTSLKDAMVSQVNAGSINVTGKQILIFKEIRNCNKNQTK